jgi:hypothetical protein
MSLLDYALRYYRKGWTPIPVIVRDKRPAVRWQEYQNKRPSLEQIHEWFDGKTLEDCNIAIVLGTVSNGLSVVDFDDMNTWIKIKGENYEKNNLVAISGSGKRHLYVISQREVKKYKLSELGIDVQSEGSIIIVPPSIHPSGGTYQFINQDKEPIKVFSVKIFVEGLVRRMGVKLPEEKELTISTSSSHISTIRPCIQVMINNPYGAMIGRLEHGLSHDARMAVASEGFALGLSDQEIAMMFKNQTDFRLSESLKQIKSLRRTWNGKPRRCQTIKNAGWCPGECRNLSLNS